MNGAPALLAGYSAGVLARACSRRIANPLCATEILTRQCYGTSNNFRLTDFIATQCLLFTDFERQPGVLYFDLCVDAIDTPT
jgi:hypothetical protein